MLTGELRNQIDGIWNDFWSGGLANPLQVIEQITYLIFIKRLDEMQELEERKATTLGAPLERRIFPEGFDGRGKPVKPGEPADPGEPYENIRWSRLALAKLGRRSRRENAFVFLARAVKRSGITSAAGAWRCRKGSWPCLRRRAARFPSISSPARSSRTASRRRTGCGRCRAPSRSKGAPDRRSCRS